MRAFPMKMVPRAPHACTLTFALCTCVVWVPLKRKRERMEEWKKDRVVPLIDYVAANFETKRRWRRRRKILRVFTLDLCRVKAPIIKNKRRNSLIQERNVKSSVSLK